MNCTYKKRKAAAKLLMLIVLALPLAGFPCLAEAGTTLGKIHKSKQLRCGVSEGLEGFSSRDSDGRWRGLDADFCRAAAAAVLGDPEKVEFVPLATSAQFPALKTGTIDLLSCNTTYTFSREVDLGLHFAGILYYDQQAVMVPRRSKVRRVSDLSGATICVVKGTAAELNLTNYFNRRSLRYTPLAFDSEGEAKAAFLEGRCQAISAGASKLTTLGMRSQKGSKQFRMLADTVGKEPLGPVIRAGDEEWLSLVKWVLFALIEAEEQGVSRFNARFQYSENADLSVQVLLGADAELGKGLGIKNNWVLRVIEAAGNYGEIFERNVGRKSRLKLDRGLNRLWSKGGLMYAPPFR